MNARLDELAKQAGIDFGNFESVTVDVDDAKKFAELIIKECRAQPSVYLLNKKDATEPESQWVLHGWADDLRVAQKWRDSSGRDDRLGHTESEYLCMDDEDFCNGFYRKRLTNRPKCVIIVT